MRRFDWVEFTLVFLFSLTFALLMYYFHVADDWRWPFRLVLWSVAFNFGWQWGKTRG